jgi:hypothetical protein
VTPDDLEQRLAAMRPADLPRDLQARLVGAVPAPRSKVRWLFIAAPLAAAAVWILFVSLHRPMEWSAPLVLFERTPQPSDFRVFLPVEETSTLVEAKDIAFIDADPAQPVRLVRATWLDDITYRGDDGRTLRRQEPRVEFIPIVLNTF